MRHATIFALVLFSLGFVSTATAGGPSLSDDGFGGFGGVVVTTSEIEGQDAVFVGGRGGWIFGERFYIGGGGFGLATDHLLPPYGEDRRLNFGYGGLELGLILFSDSLVQVEGWALFGGGGIVVGDEDDLDDEEKEDTVGVLETHAQVTLNLTDWMKIGVGGGYRWVEGVDTPCFDDEDFGGATGSVSVSFGSF